MLVVVYCLTHNMDNTAYACLLLAVGATQTANRLFGARTRTHTAGRGEGRAWAQAGVVVGGGKGGGTGDLLEGRR